MTGLLEEALRRVESLSPKEQDAIASQIIETIEDDEAWTRSFSGDRSVLRSLAQEALEEHRRGETLSWIDTTLNKTSPIRVIAAGTRGPD